MGTSRGSHRGVRSGAEVLQPGQLALGARGPSRYFGGDLALATKVAATIEAVVAGEAKVAGESGSDWAGCCRVGIADGVFAAGLAAQQAPASQPLVVRKGGSAEFLAPLPVRVLALPGPGSLAGAAGNDRLADLTDLLRRLGLKTLGAFAALPDQSVLGRFGAEGMLAHRLARGLEERTVRGRLPPPDWTVAAELDPPADQLLAAAFVGKALADELHGRLRDSGLVCTRLAIEAETEHGTSLRRSWRHDGALSAAAIGERVRWQLEGWALQAGQADKTARGGAGVPASGSKGPPGATRRRDAGRSLSDPPERGGLGQSQPLALRTAGVSSETQLPRPFSLGLGAQAGQVDKTARGGAGVPATGRSLGLGPQAGQADKTARGGAGVPASGRSLGLRGPSRQDGPGGAGVPASGRSLGLGPRRVKQTRRPGVGLGSPPPGGAWGWGPRRAK